MSIKPILGCWLMLCAVVLTGCQVVQVVSGPLSAIAVGASGPDSAKITVRPHCCPSSALLIETSQALSQQDTQWVVLEMPVVVESSRQPVKAVEVCYQIKSAAGKGRTYISQTRLTDMTTPDINFIVMDDPTDRYAMGPRCYQVATSVRPKGALSLNLQVVIGDADDQILLGSSRLIY